MDFAGYLSKEELRVDGCAYEASYDFPEILSRLRIEETDRLMDVGCGKGYAMHCFSVLPFGKIAGIEMNEALAKIAKENLAKMYPTDSRFEVVVGNACNYAGYDEYNYFYLYNPLTEEGIRKFVEQLKASLDREPRNVYLIYQNPRFWREFVQEDLFQRVVSAERCLILKHQK